LGLVDDGTTVSLVPVSAKRNWTQVGYAIGAGGEWALTQNISVKLEYLFADLGDDTRQIGTYLAVPCCVQTGSVREDDTMQSVRVGLNYRFAPR
jgi:outer membrane immunogenic protein